MKNKDDIFETDLLSEKTISGYSVSISVGSNDKKQSSRPDLNSYRGNGLHRNNDVSYPISLENFEKNGYKTKYPFIVDWQMLETF